MLRTCAATWLGHDDSLERLRPLWSGEEDSLALIICIVVVLLLLLLLPPVRLARRRCQ